MGIVVVLVMVGLHDMGIVVVVIMMGLQAHGHCGSGDNDGVASTPALWWW